MRTEERNWAPLVALAVLLLHGLALDALVRWQPTAARPSGLPHIEATDAIDIQFILRVRHAAGDARQRVPASEPVSIDTRADLSNIVDGTPNEVRAPASESVPVSRGVEAANAPLDLTVRERLDVPETRDGDSRWLEPRSPIEMQRTRFDATWTPDGDAVAQARHRSAAVRALTGLFGGPPRRCTEAERRLRLMDCLPLDADEADLEHLRRSLD